MTGAQPARTTQITQQRLPKWVSRAGKQNYDLAKKISHMPLIQYAGQDVADPSNMTTDAYKYLMANVGAEDPLYENAAALEGRITELDPTYKKALGVLAGDTDATWDPTKYLNPYTGEVEKNAIFNAERELTGQLETNADAARKAGAFGGSASAVQQAVLQAEGTRKIGDLSAELRRAGYDKATADMIADRAEKRAAAESMITGASTQGRGWLDAASGFLDTAGKRQAGVLSDVTAMGAAGEQERAYRQSLIDADKARFYEKRDYPTEMLNLRLAALGMSPYPKSESTVKTGTSEEKGPDFATLGLGLLQFLPTLLSDERDKKDITKLGTDPGTDLPIYAYRYKGEDGGPKSVGPMAQDVEKKYPEAVAEIGGHKVIKPSVLANIPTPRLRPRGTFKKAMATKRLSKNIVDLRGHEQSKGFQMEAPEGDFTFNYTHPGAEIKDILPYRDPEAEYNRMQPEPGTVPATGPIAKKQMVNRSKKSNKAGVSVR